MKGPVPTHAYNVWPLQSENKHGLLDTVIVRKKMNGIINAFEKFHID